MYWPYGNYFGWGSGSMMGWFGGWIMMVVFWGLIIYFVVWVVKKLSNTSDSANSSAINILKERFAKDEITKEEFEAKMSVLTK